MTSKASASAGGSPATPTPNNEMTENIAYMTLMHELKAAFPNLSDEAVKQCMLEASRFSMDFYRVHNPPQTW